MHKPLVSIIMPFYKYDQFILESVVSVERQTYPNVELIVIDDCSPGAPASELLAGKTKLPTKIIRNAQNLGPAACRNIGVAAAEGDLIVPLDADDLLAQDFLEKTVFALDGTSYGGVYTDVKTFGNREQEYTGDCSILNILNARGGHNTYLYRKEVHSSVGGYKEHLRIGIDKEFWLSTQWHGWKFLHIPEPLYLYRIHEAQLTENIEARGAEMMTGLFREHRELFIQHIDDWFPKRIDSHKKTKEMCADLLAECERIDREHAHLEEEIRKLGNKAKAHDCSVDGKPSQADGANLKLGPHPIKETKLTVSAEFFYADKRLYIETIDEWFEQNEKDIWDQVCFYRQVYHGWQIRHNRYLELLSKWERLNNDCLMQESGIRQATGGEPSGSVFKSVARASLSWLRWKLPLH